MLVQIILFDGFDLLDALAPYEVLTAAGIAAGGGMNVELVSASGARSVPSGPNGLPVPASGRPDLDRADIILIPGAAGPTQGEGPNTIPAILAREAAGELPLIAAAALSRPGVTTATVCGGSLILAIAGVLEGRPAVTHHMGMPMLEQAGAIPIKARVVDDGNLVTGGGVTSGIDVALHLVERALGPRIAHAVETLFEYERRGTVWRDEGAEPEGAREHTVERSLASQQSGVSSEPPAAGVAGCWDVTISTPLGEQVVVYDILITNGSPTGTATQGADIKPLSDLTVWDRRKFGGGEGQRGIFASVV
jgi:transcriptional regulator GlxA family with amidase domain